MVRLVTVHREVPVDTHVFFKHFWLSGSFVVDLHKSLGDTSVDASDWLDCGPGKAQRLLFFSRNEDGTSTRCIETQAYTMRDDDKGDFDVKILVNPENPLGQVFRIEANWSVRSKGGGDGTVVDVSLEIECKKRLWGGYGNSLVEGMLEKSARKEYDDWFAKCAEELKQMKKKESGESTFDDVRLEIAEEKKDVVEAAKPAAASVFNRHQLRHKASALGHTAVRGAERFMSALLEHAPGQDVDETRPVIHIPVEGGRGFLSPVFSPGSPRRQRRLCRRGPLVLLSLLMALMGAALWLFFHQ